MEAQDRRAEQDLLLPVDAILDALPRAVVVADRAGRIVGWNRVAEVVFGRPRHDALGLHYADVIVAHGAAGDAGLVAQVLDGDEWVGEVDVRRRDGALITIATSVRPIVDPEGEVVGFCGASEDVSLRRELEEAARDLSDRLLLALEAGDLGTWRWDMASGLTTWDPTMERLFGLEPGSFPGTYEAYRALLHPADIEAASAIIQQAIADKGSYQFDHRIVWPDGSTHWLQGRGTVILDDEGTVIGITGCTADISDRKQAELAAQERAEEAEAWADHDRHERERIQFLCDINDAALTASDHGSLMAAVASAAVPRLGDWCAVVLVPGGGAPPEIEIAHADPAKRGWARAIAERYPFDPEGPTGTAWVIRTGQVEFIPHIGRRYKEAAIDEITDVPREVAEEVIDGLGLSSIVTVPMVTKQGIIGAVQFVNAESGRTYTERDLALAEAAAGRIAAALEGALLADQQRVVAQTLQQALLPPALPAIEGATVAARFWPAGTVADVGGDFYDVFPISEDTWALVIGDVCGTGPDAASVTTIVRHTVRAAARHGASPVEVLDWVNEAINLGNRDRFCTAVYSTLQRTGPGRWTYRSVSGGHPLPVVARADGSVVSVGQPGDLLGVWPEIETPIHECELAPGDTIVLYTDGLTDVRPPHDLGVGDVQELVGSAAVEVTADLIAEQMTEAIGMVLPMARRSDDLAFVVARLG